MNSTKQPAVGDRIEWDSMPGTVKRITETTIYVQLDGSQLGALSELPIEEAGRLHPLGSKN